jgi:hypothetical protein
VGSGAHERNAAWSGLLDAFERQFVPAAVFDGPSWSSSGGVMTAVIKLMMCVN